MCFFVCFCVWKRAERCRKRAGKEQDPRSFPFFFGLKVPRAFYIPNALIKAATLQWPYFQMVSDLVDLDTSKRS